MSITRHCGVVRSTGSRVFVAWRQLENDPGHCLVIYRDSLPEVYSNRVAELVMGRGQSSIELWDVMDKIGTLEGGNMLSVLHRMGYIRKQSTLDIDMHVGGNNKIPLNLLNEEINQSAVVQDGTVKSFNPYEQQTSQTSQTQYPEQGTIVSRLLEEASKYETLANENRERAYNLDPSLRPQSQVLLVQRATDSTVGSTKPVGDSLFVELPDGISQAKAVELVKKALKERKGE
jgi:hypothetical protein